MSSLNTIVSFTWNQEILEISCGGYKTEIPRNILFIYFLYLYTCINLNADMYLCTYDLGLSFFNSF